MTANRRKKVIAKKEFTRGFRKGGQGTLGKGELERPH